MEDHSSDQSTEATSGTKGVGKPLVEYDSFGGPSSLQEHFCFPDAQRVLREFESRLSNVGFASDKSGLPILSVSEDVTVALEQMTKISHATRDLADWIEMKKDFCSDCGIFGGSYDPLSGQEETVEEIGEITGYCGNAFVWGYVHRRNDIWHVWYQDYWDTVILPDSHESVSAEDEYPEEVTNLLVDLYVHAAKEGFVEPGLRYEV